MVSGDAANDAVALAHRLPGLRVGLHLVLVDGKPTLRPERIPDLVDGGGRLRNDLIRTGIDVFLRPGMRAQLAAEIEAQFAAFSATGLKLDHVNAHHHFHLHPAVCSAVLDVGRRYAMGAVRVPREPSGVVGRDHSAGRPNRSESVMRPWVALLDKRCRRRGLTVADQVFGLAWSGAMTEERITHLLQQLPDGLTEIYCHPATSDAFFGAAAGYRYADELAALTSTAVRRLASSSNIRAGGYADFHRR
jgi:hopanoid biosynthesis associated protein HpnK